jgi:serine/threonine protein kinase
MVTAEGIVKLVDFGTAKDLVDTSRNGPEFVGTPDYMAPEVVTGGAATPASDLWALGCMLYQSAVGRTPFKVAPLPFRLKCLGCG